MPGGPLILTELEMSMNKNTAKLARSVAWGGRGGSLLP